MKIPDRDKVSAAFIAANSHLYATPEPQAMQLPHDFKPTKTDVKAEKQLQTMCQNGLNQRGYISLTNTNAAQYAGKDIRGWYGHLAKPQGNSFMSDLFIFNRTMTRCLMVELKTHNVFQVGQKEMCASGMWRLVTTYDDFSAAVAEFENPQISRDGGKEEK